MYRTWRPFLMIGLLTLFIWPVYARPGQPIVTCAGKAKAFSLSLVDAGGQLLRWEWDFGDPGSGAANISLERSPVHTYREAGRYQVRLSLVRKGGQRDTLRLPVEVRPVPAPAIRITGRCAGQPIQLWGENQDSLAQVDRWLWHFGNNRPPVEAIHTHYVYTTPGQYQVSLTLRTPDGCTASATQQVDIEPTPPPPLAQGDTVCAGQPAQLTAQAEAGAQLLWQAAGQEAVLAAGPSFTSPPLSYPVYYDVYQVQAGCRSAPARVAAWVPSAHHLHIRLQPSPIAALPEADVQFAISTPVPLSAWDWNLGDGYTSSQAAPAHRYAHPGTYDVSCWAVTRQGCRVLLRHPFVVRRPILLQFPMGFSPNGDGYNDYFQADARGVRRLHIRIYTALGQLVFEGEGARFSWDGRVLGGPPAAEGVYVYEVEAEAEGGQRIQQEGTVTLVR